MEEHEQLTQRVMSKYVNALATAQQEVFTLQAQVEMLNAQLVEARAANDKGNGPEEA